MYIMWNYLLSSSQKPSMCLLICNSLELVDRPLSLFSKYSIIFEKFSILHNAQLVNKTNKRSQVSTKELSFSVVEIFNFPRSYQQNHWYPYNKLFLQLFQTFTNSQVMHSVHCHDFLAEFRVWPKSLMNTVPNHDHNYDLFFQINF